MLPWPEFQRDEDAGVSYLETKNTFWKSGMVQHSHGG